MTLLDAVLGRRPLELEARSEYSIADPALAYLFDGPPADAGIAVTERSALSGTAFYRAVMVVGGTAATLPLRTLELRGDRPTVVSSWIDDPGFVVDRTPFEWKMLALAHMVIHGETFLLAVTGSEGQVLGAEPVHPQAVEVRRADDGLKRYKVRQVDGTLSAELPPGAMVHVPMLSTDGVRALSPIRTGRNALAVGLAGERASGKLMRNGLMMGGVLTPEAGTDLPADEAEVIRGEVQSRGGGVDNAGSVLFVNRTLKLSPWSMTLRDAQFLELRAFQIEEVSRLTGVPPHLLSQTEKQTSWGAGVGEQNRGLARYTLMPYTHALQEGLSRLLPAGRWVEFDYAGLMAGTPAEQIKLVLEQYRAGVIGLDEARALLNLGAAPDDLLEVDAQADDVAPTPELEDVTT